jgi:hypothetical protein
VLPDNLITITGQAELITAMPYLIGFHPAANTLALIGLHGPRVAAGVAVEVPDTGVDDALVTAAVTAVVARLADEGTTGVIAVGHGDRTQFAALADAVRAACTARSIQLVDLLRVSGDRFWPHLHTDAHAPAGDGIPLPRDPSVVAVHAVVAGLVPQPDMAAFAALFDLYDAEDVHRARLLAEAADRLAALIVEGDPAQITDRITRAGVDALDAAFERYADGGHLDHTHVAWLEVLLAVPSVRDHAWRRTRAVHSHMQMWTDLSRRVTTDTVAATSCLAGFAAWQLGNHGLAATALSRALAADPGHRTAQALAAAVSHGLPASVIDGWLPTADNPSSDSDNRAE